MRSDWRELEGSLWRYRWGGSVFRIAEVLWPGTPGYRPGRDQQGLRISNTSTLSDTLFGETTWVPITDLAHLCGGCEPIKVEPGCQFVVDHQMRDRLRRELADASQPGGVAQAG